MSWNFVLRICCCLNSRDVDDPVYSQWVFVKSRLEHYLSKMSLNTEPVSNLESSMSLGMKVKFEKHLEEGFDLNTDLLYSSWKQLKASNGAEVSLSEHNCFSMHLTPKPACALLASQL